MNKQPLSCIVAESGRLLYARKENPYSGLKIRSSSDTANFVRPNFPDVDFRESFAVLALSRSNTVLGYSVLFTGGVSGVVADVKNVMQYCLGLNASCFILVHNHPSGNLYPSEADKQLTQKMKEAGQVMDLSLLDHVILTNDSHYSFIDEGIL